MKRVLLTGATGFLGRHCLPILTELAEEVHAVTSSSVAPVAPGVHWHSANLHDAEQTQQLLRRTRPTHLLHLAWYTKPALFWTSPANSQWVESSLRLLREFARWQGERVVTAGTCAEYDWSEGVCHEFTTPLRPATPYGRSKAALYWATESLAQTHGLSAAWARLFFLYGPGAPAEKFPAAIYHSLAAGRPARCTAGDQQRDFLFVRDAAEALVTLLSAEANGPVNVASGTSQRLAEIAEILADQMGQRHRLQLGALLARSDEPPLLVADVTRLRDELHWKPKFSLEQGLAETINWFERNTRALPAAA